MATLLAILGWAVFGLLAGALARLLVPGRQAMSLWMTMGLGILGSMAGGLMTWLLAGGRPWEPAGFLMSVIGAIAVLALTLYFKRQSANHA